MKKLLYFLLVICSQNGFSQQDSILISAKLSNDLKTLTVNQTIIYHNIHDREISKIKLQNWIAAYKNRDSKLLKRKLQDRKNDLYFAKYNDLGGLLSLNYTLDADSVNLANFDNETIYIPLKRNLKPQESQKVTFNYKLTLPKDNFTGYGTNREMLAIKYFFITPDYFEDHNQSPNYFIDVEQNLTSNSFWNINWELPPNWLVRSNLHQNSDYHFEGTLTNDPEFLLTQNALPEFKYNVKGQDVLVQLGYPVSVEEHQFLDFYLPYQLQFIKDKIGLLPSKVFISEKFKNREKFIGVDDVKFWNFNYKLFSNGEKVDLNYFSILSKSVLNNVFFFDKIKDHWLINGLKTYLEIEYLKDQYAQHKLLGDLPNQATILGLKPLKIFHASELMLQDRYGLAYQYILNQNLDQPIDFEYNRLSNFNTTAVSHFKMGMLFKTISEKIGTSKFDNYLKTYFLKNSKQQLKGKDFLSDLDVFTNHESAFILPMVKEKNRINFKLKNFEIEDDKLLINVTKNIESKLPIKLALEHNNGKKDRVWLQLENDNEVFKLDYNDTDKILINDDFTFPETSLRDNYLYTKGLFSNMKKIKFKLLKDIKNPEFNEIFLMPRLSFNAYDKVLLGLNFVNKGLLDQKFIYSVTPYYSTGTNRLTGSAGVSYNIQPKDSFFRSWLFSTNMSYFHYNYNLAYKRINLSTSINLNKDPRSAIGRNIYASYGYFEKDIDPISVTDDYNKYNLWNVGFTYSDNALIHEKSINSNLQGMEDFLKLTSEAYYRWEYAQDKKISFRWFVGYFINNKTKNSTFDYGLSRVSNYAFSYGLFGQSATSGLFSQQFILAEGGFKSHFNRKVNHWLTSINVDSHVWKIFNLYADFGVYKNNNEASNIIWDSGIKLRIIPDFLEVYFPVQSSLGFEPGMKDYGYRIRYTLVFNLNSLIGNLRRGVY